MSESVATINILLATGGIGLFIASSIMLFDIFFQNRSNLQSLIKKWGLLVLSVLFIGTMFVALLYSEVFGFEPCGLCWTMRIFVFSQAIILPFAYIRKDTSFAFYGIILSFLGATVGLYQHYLQMGGSEFLPCPSAGGDCAQRILFEYGFMTFPLMGVALLVFAILTYSYLLKEK